MSWGNDLVERVGLVSCVKQKLDHPAAAGELYTSTLFRGARRYVQRSCDRWFVLSAQHHLLRPDQVIAPYERTLNDAGMAERRRWSRQVVEELEHALGDLRDVTFEIHAGRNYYDFGLATGLVARGATVELPLEGLRLGERLSYYREHAR